MSDELDKLLRQLAARPLPAAPRNLDTSVWREIRQRESLPEISWLDLLASLLWQCEVAFVSVVAALLMGASVGWMWQGQARQPAVSRALYLEVFSERSPTLPSTQIALHR